MEINRQIVEGYSEGADKENARKWCWLFKDGCGCMNSLSGKFLSILHAFPTLRKVINTCCTTSRNFWPAKSVTDQEGGREDILLEWLEGLAVTFFNEGI